jgi:hypothetical protein
MHRSSPRRDTNNKLCLALRKSRGVNFKLRHYRGGAPLVHGSHSVRLSPTRIWREMSHGDAHRDFARCCHVLAPALDGIDIEVADALNQLCDT